MIVAVVFNHGPIPQNPKLPSPHGYGSVPPGKIGYNPSMRKLLLLIAISLLAVAVHAQKADDKPLPLAKLAAPVSVTFKTADLEWLRYGGTIAATVLVDKKGKITMADLTGPVAPCSDLSSDHLLALRTATAEAVKKARVEPATDADGNPVNGGMLIKIKVPQDEAWNAQYAAGRIPGDSKTVGGGVLNGRAISLAKPEYPSEARANRAAGQVNVEVHIDETGKVIYAGATNGNPYLRYAAADAACRSKFSPTLLSGQPVKVFGIITYNFIP